MKVDSGISVCIVGAGPAGLTAAHTLKQRGYTDVTVFEKQDRVGGKCLSYEYPEGSGQYFDMGGTMMSAGYTNIMRIAREVGAETCGDVELRLYDRTHGVYRDALYASTQMIGVSFAAMMWGALRFGLLLLGPYRKFSLGRAGLAHAPPELCQPLGTWSRQRGLEAIAESFVYTMQVGYGRTDEVCAAYFVKFENFLNWVSTALSVLGISRKWPRYFRDGFQSLWERVAANLDVVLEADIERIEREVVEDRVVVRMKLRGEHEERVFDQLILACPLDLDTLGFLNVTPVERELFSRIQNIDYYSTACEVRGLPAGLVINSPVPAAGHPTGFIKTPTNDEVGVFFSVGGPDVDPESVTRAIEQTVAELPPVDGEKPQVRRVLQQHHWRFFPHATPDEFAAGFFDRLEALQGHRNTLYMSSLLSFELVSDTASYAKGKVEAQFPDQTRREAPYIFAMLGVLAAAVLLMRFVGI